MRGNWREVSFTGGPEGKIKEGSGEVHLSPKGHHSRNLKARFFHRGFRQTVKEGSANEGTLSMVTMHGEYGKGAPLLGTPKVLEIEH